MGKYKVLIYSGTLLATLMAVSSQNVKANTENTNTVKTVSAVLDNSDANTDDSASKAEIVHSGNVGTADSPVNWTIDSNGLLTISGGTIDQHYVGENAEETPSISSLSWISPYYINSVKKIKITGKLILPRDSSSVFSNLYHLTEIDGMENVDTENVENFAGMFENDEELESLDVSKFDTSNATDLSNIFWRLRKVPSLDGSKFTPIKNRALAAGTDWYSDKVVILGSGDDAVKYVRVATDEWMKLSDGYRYENKKLVVTTNNDNMTQLLKSEAVPATNRALGPRSSWLVDRIGYLDTSDNPKGFYRVATNEFVDPDNVSI